VGVPPIKVSDFSASCQVANVTSHLSTEIWRGIPCGLKDSLSRGLASKFTSTVETDALCPVALHHRDIRKVVGLGAKNSILTSIYPLSIPNLLFPAPSQTPPHPSLTRLTLARHQSPSPQPSNPASPTSRSTPFPSPSAATSICSPLANLTSCPSFN
jgi:hypothetical protein